MCREHADRPDRFEKVVLLFRLVIGVAVMRAARLLSKIASFAMVIFILYWVLALLTARCGYQIRSGRNLSWSWSWSWSWAIGILRKLYLTISVSEKRENI
jgi:hypothetical protein